MNSYMFYFYVVVNETVVVFVGEPVIVREDVQVTINCSQLIDEAINNGISNPNVTWYKDGVAITNSSHMNIFISADDRLCIITDTSLSIDDQLGTAGNYTCEVCNTTGCINETTSQFVCGKYNLMLKYYLWS